MSHCLHFGICGGCAVDDRSAVDFPQILKDALVRGGFENPPIAPLVEIPLNSRRRVDLAATRVAGTITLGLHRARSKVRAELERYFDGAVAA